MNAHVAHVALARCLVARALRARATGSLATVSGLVRFALALEVTATAAVATTAVAARTATVAAGTATVAAATAVTAATAVAAASAAEAAATASAAAPATLADGVVELRGDRLTGAREDSAKVPDGAPGLVYNEGEGIAGFSCAPSASCNIGKRSVQSKQKQSLEREETTAGACAGRLANSAANRRNMGGEPCCFLLRHFTQPAVPTRPAVPTITSFFTAHPKARADATSVAQTLCRRRVGTGHVKGALMCRKWPV